jgi:hypothetical protein
VSQTVFFFNRFIFAYFLTPIPIMPDKKKPPTKLGVKMQNTQITTKVKEPKYGLYLLSTSPTAQDAA